MGTRELGAVSFRRSAFIEKILHPSSPALKMQKTAHERPLPIVRRKMLYMHKAAFPYLAQGLADTLVDFSFQLRDTVVEGVG